MPGSPWFAGSVHFKALIGCFVCGLEIAIVEGTHFSFSCIPQFGRTVSLNHFHDQFLPFKFDTCAHR